MSAYIERFEQDTIPTAEGDLSITFIGHSALIFQFRGKTVHIDPIMREADYTELPGADVIIITHEHHDHFDVHAIQAIQGEGTDIVCPQRCADKLDSCHVVNNNESVAVQGFHIEAIPAYNIVHMRDANTPFHPKGHGNGYILSFGDKRVYIAGDTENTPEMKSLQNIDIAFLPMNVPVTMSPEMVEDAVRAFRPKVLYPYHYGDTMMKWGETDPYTIVHRLNDADDVEVRIRKMK